MLHGRDAERLAETQRACADPDRHVVWAFDLGRPELIADELRGVVPTWGGVDALVHCAGSALVLPLRSLDAAAMRRTFDLNVFGATELLRALASRRVNDERLRSALFVSSTWAKVGGKGHAAYAAAKAAVDAFVRCAALELAPRVTLNSLVLGGVETAMSAAALLDTEIAASIARDVPLGLGRPEEVAEVIAFLVSERNRWMTGQEVVLDGGRTINFSLK